MTSQGAGAPTDGSQLDLDEADRLAESIRPAWETEDSHDKPPAGAAASAPPAGAEPPHDTLIDAAPIMQVGKTDPGRTDPAEPLRPSQLEPANRPVPPKPAKSTVMGLGASDEVMAVKKALADVAANGPSSAEEKKKSVPPETAAESKPVEAKAAEPAAEKAEVTTALPVKKLVAEAANQVSADGASADGASADEAPASRPSKSQSRSKRKTKDGVGPEARDSDRGRRSAASAAPAGSAGVSFSKVDDPVELPVEKSSKGLYIGGAVALVGVLVVGGLLSMGGDDPPKQPAAPATTQASEPATKPDPKPTATEAKTPEPTPTPTAVETAAPAAEATATPTAEPAATPDPAAKKDPPPTKPAAGKPPSSGGSGPSKPSGGGGGKKGGIMRDAPF